MNTTETLSKNGHERAIQAAIFDLDGVLMDTEWLAFRTWCDIVASFGGKLEEEHFTAMIGGTAEENAELIMQVTGVTFDIKSSVADMWQHVLGRIRNGIQPQPGAAELLRSLTRRGLPLAVASNSPTDYVQTSLQGLGLAEYFQETIGVDQVKEGKPAPDSYLLAAQKLGADPSRCLAVEDSYVGSQAALRAGMRVLAVPSKRDNHERFQSCYRIYDSLLQVGDELEGLLKAT